MAQMKYKETQHLRQWDLLIVIGALIMVGVTILAQMIINGQPNRNLLLVTSLSILILSGLFYYIHSLKIIARYNEKNIKVRMLPIGTEKRKIKWSDVVESEIVELPKFSKIDNLYNLLSSFSGVITRSGETCLHLKLKNNEEINIGCANRQELEQIVRHIKQQQPGLQK